MGRRRLGQGYSILVITFLLFANLAAFADSQIELQLDVFKKIYSAEQCKDCHQKEYSEWSKSRHKAAYTNNIFAKGYELEPSAECLNCHLPEVEQRTANWFGSRKDFDQEGVTCVSCHSREHVKPHEKIGTSTCAKCHQFSFSRTNVESQQTLREWRRYQFTGGTKSCSDCHMPKGSHQFPGAWSDDMLKKALAIRVLAKGEKTELSIQNIGAGHNVPTGDIYRHIVVEAKYKNRSLPETLANIGRNPYFKAKQLNWKNNSSLKPGEIRKMETRSNGLVSLRVIYLYEAEWAGRIYKKSSLTNSVIFEKEF